MRSGRFKRPTCDLFDLVDKVHSKTKMTWLASATQYYGAFHRGLRAVQKIPRRRTLVAEALLAALVENA